MNRRLESHFCERCISAECHTLELCFVHFQVDMRYFGPIIQHMSRNSRISSDLAHRFGYNHDK